MTGAGGKCALSELLPRARAHTHTYTHTHLANADPDTDGHIVEVDEDHSGRAGLLRAPRLLHERAAACEDRFGTADFRPFFLQAWPTDCS